MKPEPFELQHDDHCWLTVNGESWEIYGIEWPFIWLWRGFLPEIEYTRVDMKYFRSEEYCDKAVQLLRELYS